MGFCSTRWGCTARLRLPFESEERDGASGRNDFSDQLAGFAETLDCGRRFSFLRISLVVSTITDRLYPKLLKETTMARRGQAGDKSQAIRDLISQNPQITAKEANDTLAVMGIKTSPDLFYFVKGKMT